MDAVVYAARWDLAEHSFVSPQYDPGFYWVGWRSGGGAEFLACADWVSAEESKGVLQVIPEELAELWFLFLKESGCDCDLYAWPLKLDFTCHAVIGVFMVFEAGWIHW